MKINNINDHIKKYFKSRTFFLLAHTQDDRKGTTAVAEVNTAGTGWLRVNQPSILGASLGQSDHRLPGGGGGPRVGGAENENKHSPHLTILISTETCRKQVPCLLLFAKTFHDI